MSGDGGRACPKTGLRLFPVRDDRTFRIAEHEFGAVSAPTRDTDDDRTMWGRFDSPGCTIYTAATRESAYVEVLSQFKRKLGENDPLEADAAALSMSRDQFLEEIASEWDARSFMGVGAVPASWRHKRRIYELRAEGSGWWIVLDHPATLSTLERVLEPLLIEEGVPALTLGVLTGENRRITTAVGEYLRRIELDDGTQARGLQFPSKFGGSWCRAIWLPQEDETWQADILELIPELILVSDEDLAQASKWLDIRVF